MGKFRVIYVIEAFDCNVVEYTSEVTVRRYARNKKTAEKIVKQIRAKHPGADVSFHPVHKPDHCWVNPADVENL